MENLFGMEAKNTFESNLVCTEPSLPNLEGNKMGAKAKKQNSTINMAKIGTIEFICI